MKTTIGMCGTSNTSRRGIIGYNPYPFTNQSFQRTRRQLMITWHGLKLSISRMCYHRRKGVDKFGRRGNVDIHKCVHKRGCGHTTGSSSVPIEDTSLVATQYSGQFVPLNFLLLKCNKIVIQYYII